MLKPGGRLLIRSPGSLDHCRREQDFRSVTAFFENWRYNFLGANILVFKLRGLGFKPIKAASVALVAKTALGVLPAHQGLEAHDAAVGQDHHVQRAPRRAQLGGRPHPDALGSPALNAA